MEKAMEYEEIKPLKQSGKSAVYLVREKDSEQVYIRKILKGQHPIYATLQNCAHPCLPRLYEVAMSKDSTTVIEEYIEGQPLGNTELSEKQFLHIVKDLCSVLELLHGKGIIHRDIKPSNVILAKDGHIRLIDFDAARMPKDDLEQDTRLLGTRGYAPPEQYGFSQTDERADIYSLGVTLDQLLQGKAKKPRYRRIIRKCTDLNPDKRYQSVRKVKKAFFHTRQGVLCAGLAILAGGGIFLWNIIPDGSAEMDGLTADAGLEGVESENTESGGTGFDGAEDDSAEHNGTEAEGLGGIETDSAELTVLSAPADPHWDGESGIALWGNVFESGFAKDDVEYQWKLYRMDTETPPDLAHSELYWEGEMSSNRQEGKDFFEMNLASYLYENGFYYFAAAATGDGIYYADSPFVLSDAFEYTGESAPALPVPEGLEWRIYEGAEESGRYYWATWSNLDDYADTDSFNVCVYDKDGNYVMNNIWTKADVVEAGYSGINIRREFLTEAEGRYRFTVQALTSRPNEYQSSPMPDPVPEEYFSPWYYR